MGPAQTYELAVLNNPLGFALSGVTYLDAKGRRSPIWFKAIGETIDLGRVDLGQFVESVRTGSIKDLAESGTLVAVAQDLSERRMDEYMAAVAKNSGSSVLVNVATRAHVEVLEPGLQVAVGGSGALSPETPKTPAGPPPVEPEAPVVAPGAGLEDSDGPSSSSVVVAPVVAEEAPAPASEIPEEPAVAGWKANKNLAEQEAYITASEDKKFLTDLIADPAEESSRLKNVAKKRLADLKA